jgi:hypothetical protein
VQFLFTQLSHLCTSIEREKEYITYEKQIVLLKDIADAMAELGSSVDFFAQYWTRMETVLETVSGRVDDLRGSKYFGMRLMTISKDWEDVRANLSDYVNKVSEVDVRLESRILNHHH